MTSHLPITSRVPRSWAVRLLILLGLLFAAMPGVQAKGYGEIEQQRIDLVFPKADSVSEPQGEFKVRPLPSGDRVLG